MDQQELRTVPQACAYLAISRGMLYQLLRSGEIRSVKIGAARRIPLAELRRYVDVRLAASAQSQAVAR